MGIFQQNFGSYWTYFPLSIEILLSLQNFFVEKDGKIKEFGSYSPLFSDLKFPENKVSELERKRCPICMPERCTHFCFAHGKIVLKGATGTILNGMSEIMLHLLISSICNNEQRKLIPFRKKISLRFFSIKC